jgi:hypothetical protein
VAVTISAPEDQAALDYEKEAFRLQAALSNLGQHVAFADLGGVEDLVEVVKGQKASAVHFSGHGLPGHLVFEDDEGFADSVPVAALIRRLKQALGSAGTFPAIPEDHPLDERLRLRINGVDKERWREASKADGLGFAR